jgi:NAD(P)H-dependent flavin oxidoreductase YrpB (nitropropane dioxygenase family)
VTTGARTNARTTDQVAHRALDTAATELFGVRYPIVQTGMGWVSGARLTAATANAGGLGILASATMGLDELDDAISKVAQRTDAPFGVNLLPSQPDATDRIGLLIRREVRVASFAAAPLPGQVSRLRDAGIATVVTVGAPRHAEKVHGMGVDAVIAQGGEGGGHTGTIPTSLLVPGVVEATRGTGLVVLAAGGMHDGASLAGALAWGAHGMAMGTRFLLTAESHVPDHVKQVYLEAGLNATVVTTAIDGAPQRVIRTEVIDALESARGPLRFARAARNAVGFARHSGTSPLDLLRTARNMRATGDLTWSQLALAANAPMMTRASVVDGDLEVGILPTGQVVGSIDDLPSVDELIAGIVADASVALERVCDGSGSGAEHGAADRSDPRRDS